MERVRLVGAHPRHIGRIANNMRAIDRREAAAMGHNPKQALRAGLQASTWALTALVDDKPVAMMGVAPVSVVEGIGIPFLLGTNEIYSEPRAMLMKGRSVIQLMQQTFPRLENLVSVENAPAIRLLRRWGFTIGEAIQTFGGVEFVKFEKSRV